MFGYPKNNAIDAAKSSRIYPHVSFFREQGPLPLSGNRFLAFRAFTIDELVFYDPKTYASDDCLLAVVAAGVFALVAGQVAYVGVVNAGLAGDAVLPFQDGRRRGRKVF